MKKFAWIIILLSAPLWYGFDTVKVIPEMKECLAAHDSQDHYRQVLEQYCDSGLIRQAMGLLVIRNPYVVHSEADGDRICYTVEGETIGTSSEIPSDTVQTYRACWQDGRIVALEFFGAKSAKPAVVSDAMQECMAAHDTPDHYQEVLKKYCDSDMIRKAMALLVIKSPRVVHTAADGACTCYTVEGVTVGTSDEFPADATQVYRVWWCNDRIKALTFLGPKGAMESY